MGYQRRVHGHNYLVKSMSPFFSSLLHYEIAKVVTFFKDMIWVKLVSLQSVFYIFCVFCHSTKVKKKKNKKKKKQKDLLTSLFFGIFCHTFFMSPVGLIFCTKGLTNYLVKSMSPFFSSLLHFEIA